MNLSIGIELGAQQAALFAPPAGNVITNWQQSGAVVGVVGSGGAVPTGSTFGTVSGVTLEIVSITPMMGGNAIRYRFAGTATAAGNLFVSVGGLSSGAPNPGETWEQSVAAQRIAGAPADITMQSQWRLAGGGFNGTFTGVTLNFPTLTRATNTSVAPASTAQAGHFMIRTGIAINDVVNVDWIAFGPTLRRTA